MSDRVVTVVVADDHRLTREGTAALLRADHRLRVVGLAADGDEAIAVALQTRPSVVLLDLNIPDRSGIEVAAILRQRLPESRVLILTVSQRDDDLYAAMRVGADGYLLKDVPPHHLINAVLDVDQGDPLIDAPIAARILQDLAIASDAAAVAARRSEAGLTADLSVRERDVLALLARGSRNREIADALFVSEATVKTHVRHILDKLHVRNRAEAAAYAGRVEGRQDRRGPRD